MVRREPMKRLRNPLTTTYLKHDYNHAQNRQTSDKSLQKSVWDVGFAEWESSVHCGKDTVEKYREALVI